MNTQSKVKSYIQDCLNTVGYVCPSIGPFKCGTNQIVFKDVALDMGLEYAVVDKKTVMVRCKQI